MISILRLSSDISINRIKLCLILLILFYQFERKPPSLLKLEIANQKLKQEIAQRKKAQERLLQMALYNQITDLANYNSFISRLKQALQQTKTQPDYGFAILLIDCDREGEIKQSLGYTARKKLTIAIANSLTSLISKSSFLSRFDCQGIEEFLLWAV